MDAALAEKDTGWVVRELLETLNERKAGYKEAAEQVKDQELAEFFTSLAENTTEQIDDLIVFARRNKNEGPGPLGTLFRTWMNLRSSLSAHKASVILKDCLAGEESAIKIYEGALNAEVPENIRRILRRHRSNMLQVSAELERRLKFVRSKT